LLGSGFQRLMFPFLWVTELFPASATSFYQQQLTTTELIPLRVRLTLQLAVYRQSVRLGAKPFVTHGHQFLFLN
jgi:hypothetical protein